MKAASSETSGAPQVVDGERKTINSELWHACAGPLVSLPPVGSLVYYFPQGHVEQVAASTQKVADTHIPNYPNLPSQLLCQLHNVTLHADLETDEVYAQMTLQPVTSYNKDALVASDLGLKQSRQPTEFFCKTLTASDTSTHGGFSVPRRAAEKVFPALDYNAQPPAQELVAKDLHDKAWTFRHIYRGQPKRHLLTTGWSVFVSSKRLVAGDSVLFIRDEKSQLLLGIRRANRQQTSMPLSVLSTDSMHIGVLAAAAHAAANQSPFTVFYNPRTSPSEFVVPLAKYNKAFYGTQVSIGMRFRMMFETEESSVRRYMGTITGISDLDPVRWPNSQWRNLQVGWDESGAGDKQNRVSIWEIETVATPFFICPPFFRLKRPLLPGILGEDSEIEAASKRSFPWLREENDVLDFQNPLPGAGLDAWMGLQQRNGVMNPNSSGDLYRSMAGGAALQELGRNNDVPKELCTSQPMLQSRDLQNSVAPLQDHLQSQILLQQMQQQIQNPQQQLTPQQVPLQQLQQSLLPGQLQQPVQQNQILQKLQQQIPPNSPQQKLQQQLQQNSLQPKLQKPVQSNLQVQQLEQQLHQQLHQQAHQNLSQMQQQQLLLQTLFNQQVSTQQLDQAPPNLKIPQNHQLQELQKSHNKEVLQKLFQHAIPGSAQQRVLMQSHQQMQLPKQPTLTSQPLDNHLLPQQIQPDQPGQNQQIVQQQLPSNQRVQNQPIMHSAALQQLNQKGSEHSSFTHQQTQLQTTPQIREADGQLLQTISSRSPSENHILHSLSARSHSEGQLLQTLSARSHSGLLSVKSQPELSETDISFCSTTTSTNAGPLPSILTKPQLCNVSMEDKSLRVPRTGTLNTDGLSHIADHISQQPVNSLLSSNKEVNHGEMKALTSLLSSEIERQSMSSGIPAVQSTAVQQPLPPASNAFWYGNGSYDNDFQADPRNNVLFGVNIENNLADVSTTSTLVSREFNVVKDAPCQLSAESIVSTLSTTKDVQPQLSSASILSSHSLGVQDLPDNSDVASTVEDNHFLQRAPTYQQPAPPMRTYTKVYKLGNVGRSIDVTRYKNYGELRHELARMFGLEGQLEDPKKTGWQLVFVDHENDILLVGDDPWEEFVSCVRYIKILSPQEVLQMSQEGMDIVNNADDNNIWRETHF